MNLQALMASLLSGNKFSTHITPGTGVIVYENGSVITAHYNAKRPYWLSNARQHALFVPASMLRRVSSMPAPCSPLAKCVTIWAVNGDGSQTLLTSMGILASTVAFGFKLIIEADISNSALGVSVIRRNDKFLIDELYSTVRKPGWNGLAIDIPHQQYTTNTKETKMQDLSAILFGEELYAVSVNFKNSSKAYTYKSTKAHSEGDKVIVDSPSDGMVVVTVVGCRRGLSTEATGFDSYKWIVGVVDTTEYKRLVEAERDFVRKAKQEAQRRDAIKKLADLGVSPEDYRKAILGE